MGASGADKLILLVQTNQVRYCTTNLPPGTKSLIKGDIWQIGVEIGVNSECTIVVVLLPSRQIKRVAKPMAVSRFSFLGGGVTAPSDFSFLVSPLSFLVSHFSVAV